MANMTGQGWPDCESGVRAWIEAAVTAMANELGGNCVGIYMHGSLAQGSYHPPKSDVDLLFVCHEPLSADDRKRFAQLCVERSAARPTVGGLELSLITAAAVQRPDHPMPFEVHFGDEHAEEILADLVEWTETKRDPDLVAHCQSVRERGIALLGPPIDRVFGPVPEADFWDSVLADLEWILEGEHILESPFYSILNACRTLMVRSGAYPGLVPGKWEAGVWAESILPAPHHTTVREALDAYQSGRALSSEERQTGGRVWDTQRLLAFRDYIRGLELMKRLGGDPPSP